MICKAYTVVFEGVEASVIEVQCALSAGLPGFSLVGLPNKSVSEARDRVRSALASMAIALPSKRITVNLSPADLPKTGSHFDLPIALALLAALEIIPRDAIALGEISLDGTLVPVRGARRHGSSGLRAGVDLPQRLQGRGRLGGSGTGHHSR